ncbi:MAG TPA: tRNA lysidine(34) synthetase TilS, partial [Flavitalea sp.]|nr:tRNA lysidine(34) synthetase TilS [Flavitalea sp.]
MPVISINMMLERFINYINSRRLFSPLDTLVVAVSGGIDSVVLVNLFRQTSFRFVIAHMNFNLREKDSERDELFVRNLAREAGAPVFVKNVDTVGYATANKLSIQETARVLRYEWFELLRQDLVKESSVASDGGSALIVTAHHLDDSVETMMMNFFRGTGITGLRGILPVQGKIVRPLLCFTKEEIVSYAKSRELTWVEDVSNQQDKYTRNYFRNNVIPMIQRTYPQVNQNLYNNLARFNDAFILYRESIDKNIRKLVVVEGSELHIPVLKLRKMPAKETILFEIIQNYGFTASQVPQVMSLMDGETGKQVLSDKFRVIKNRNWLIIAPVQQEDTGYVVIEPEDDKVTFEKGVLKIRRQ